MSSGTWSARLGVVVAAAEAISTAAQKLTLALWWSLAAVLLVVLFVVVGRLAFTRQVEIEPWQVSPQARAAGIEPEQITRLFADELSAASGVAVDRLPSVTNGGPRPSFVLPQDDLPQDFEIKSAGISLHQLASNLRWFFFVRPIRVNAEVTFNDHTFTVTVHAAGKTSRPLEYGEKLPDGASVPLGVARDSAKRALALIAPHYAAVAYFQTGQAALAEEVLFRVAATDEGLDKAQAINMLGVIALSGGRLDEAEIRFRQALSEDARYVNAYSNLGIVSESRHDFVEAERRYRAALERDAQCVPALVQLGHLLVQQGNTTEGVQKLRRAISLQPHGSNAAIAYANLALAMASQLDVADRAYEAAAENAPDNESIRLGWGLLYLDRNPRCTPAECRSLLESARRHLTEARDLAPTDPRARMALGDAYFQLARAASNRADIGAALENARVEFEEAVGLDNSADAQHRLGATLLSLGRLQEGLEAFGHAIEIDRATLPMICGEISGRTEAAFDALRRRCSAAP